MKTLDMMTNVEKAKLLHQLVPEGIADFLSYAKQTAELITGEPDKVKENWNNQLFTADFWIGLAEYGNKKIVQYDQELNKRSGVFADQLFDGYNAFFAIHCLWEYATHDNCRHTKFKEAIALLFR